MLTDKASLWFKRTFCIGFIMLNVWLDYFCLYFFCLWGSRLCLLLWVTSVVFLAFLSAVSGLQLWHGMSEGEDSEVPGGAWEERRASAPDTNTPANRYKCSTLPRCSHSLLTVISSVKFKWCGVRSSHRLATLFDALILVCFHYVYF